jgi:hypothetical protein
MEKEIYYWKQKNGKLISVDDMTEDHLRNVLKLIIRNSQLIEQKKKTNEITLNGEIAQMMNDMYEDNELYDDHDYQHYQI